MGTAFFTGAISTIAASPPLASRGNRSDWCSDGSSRARMLRISSLWYAPTCSPCPQYRADQNTLRTARFPWQFLELPVCPVLWGRKCWKTWDRHGARPVRPDCMGRYDRRPWRLGPNVGSILKYRQQDSPPCAKLSGHNGRL